MKNALILGIATVALLGATALPASAGFEKFAGIMNILRETITENVRDEANGPAPRPDVECEFVVVGEETYRDIFGRVKTRKIYEQQCS